jgi:exodeoxyribonuclease V alpha subunit
MQELQGVIDNIVFQSEDNQFSVFRVKTDHEGKVSVVYRGPAPFLGESVELSGSWGEHAKFGRQFRAEVCQAIKPSTTDGVERFLASGAVKLWPPVSLSILAQIRWMFYLYHRIG